ncbi:MAG: methyltransferase domain-containing protein [Albidovulum sp.]
MNKTAEFDKYVDQYDEDHRSSIRLSGETPGYFAQYKIKALRSMTDAWGFTNPRILDFGAGMGASVPAFRSHFPEVEVTLADVSADSLKAARHLHAGDETHLVIDNGRVPADDASYDVVFTACVFHHIPHDEHAAWLSELRRIVRPGGRIVIFEHNPLNPLTLHAVRNCPFDVNAHLIGAREMARRVSASGWVDAKVDFHVFFPAALASLRPLEGRLRWCPLGAQYACHAMVPE